MITLAQRRTVIQSLPEMLREAITSMENMEAIQKIAEVHRLHIDQATELDDEVNLVMLGITPLDQFSKNLSSRLQVSEREAEAIATEIDAHVLQKIKHELMEATASPHVQEVIKNSTVAKVLGHPVDSEVPEEKVSREQALHELETPPFARIKQVPHENYPAPGPSPAAPPSPSLPEIKPEQELVLPKDNPPGWLLEQFKEGRAAPTQTKPSATTPPPPNPLYKPPMPEFPPTPSATEKSFSGAEPVPAPANKLNSIQQAPKATMDMRAPKKPSPPYATDPYREPIE